MNSVDYFLNESVPWYRFRGATNLTPIVCDESMVGIVEDSSATLNSNGFVKLLKFKTDTHLVTHEILTDSGAQKAEIISKSNGAHEITFEEQYLSNHEIQVKAFLAQQPGFNMVCNVKHLNETEFEVKINFNNKIFTDTIKLGQDKLPDIFYTLSKEVQLAGGSTHLESLSKSLHRYAIIPDPEMGNIVFGLSDWLGALCIIATAIVYINYGNIGGFIFGFANATVLYNYLH